MRDNIELVDKFDQSHHSIPKMAFATFLKTLSLNGSLDEADNLPGDIYFKAKNDRTGNKLYS